MTAADFRIKETANGPTLHAVGDWTALALGNLPDRLAQTLGNRKAAQFALAQLGRDDTAGTLILLFVADAGHDIARCGRKDLKRLAELC